MSALINQAAPDFAADTTHGKINGRDWIGSSWAVLFSHPKDFTPVCTVELGCVAKLEPEFERGKIKVIGLPVDSTTDHERWADGIQETRGTRLGYAIIGDFDRIVPQPE